MQRLFFSILLIIPFAVSAQIPQDSGLIKWKSFPEAGELFQETKKPIFVFIADKNNDSQRMIDSIFYNEEVCNYINAFFYPVLVDNTTKDSILYLDGNKYAPGGKHHALSQHLLGDKPGYPAVVILNKEGYGMSYVGYKNRDHIFPVLIYHAEGVYQHTTFEDYKKVYFKTYPPDNTRGYTITRSIVKWMDIEEAFEKNKEQPKKIFIDLYANWNVGSTVQYITAYNHPVNAKILNENYYPVRFTTTTQDTINLMGIEYINENKPHKYHQLAIAMLQGKMNFPAIMIIGKNNKPIYAFQRFFTPEQLEPVLKYFAEDKHNSGVSLEEYKKNFESKVKEYDEKKAQSQ